MSTLYKASHQWASRPMDERFLSLTDMLAAARAVRSHSVARVLASRSIEAVPVEDDHKALALVGPNGGAVMPTHWSFGQLAALAAAPAGYLRALPGALAADCINHGLMTRDVSEIGLLLHKPEGGEARLSAATGPNYGRIWNETVLAALINKFGDGVAGEFRVPGEFGKAVPITLENTTLYASDRDMFVFLADEANRIEVKDRRNGAPGSLARGFFVWNSEVGSATLGIGTFLFDYVCSNRIVWGAKGYSEIKLRHTSGAPHRWIEEVAPAIQAYAKASERSIQELITDARAHSLGGPDKVTEFLLKRKFTKGQAQAIVGAHLIDEDRPIESLWDVTTGITAYARQLPHQDERVKMERAAGEILNLAA